MATTNFPSAQWSEPQNSGAAVKIQSVRIVGSGSTLTLSTSGTATYGIDDDGATWVIEAIAGVAVPVRQRLRGSAILLNG